MAPWVAIIPDTVPPSQRGECVMVISWCNTILQLLGGGLAYVVGQRLPCFGRAPCLGVREMWWLNVWVLFAVCPIYYLACNGRACDGCSLRGLFKPEQPKPRPAAPAAPAAGVGGAAAPPRRCCQAARDTLRDFTSAFRDPCFRWYWLYLLNSNFAGIIAGTFTFYWCRGRRSHASRHSRASRAGRA